MKLLTASLRCCLAASVMLISVGIADAGSSEASQALDSLRKKKVDQAVKQMEEFASLRADHPYAGVMALRLVEAYLRTGRLAMARASLDHLVESGVLPAYRDEIESADAVLTYLTKPTPDTLNSLRGIIEKHPNAAIAVLGESFVFRFPSP